MKTIKTVCALLLTFSSSVFTVTAQYDNLYVMKTDADVDQYTIEEEVDDVMDENSTAAATKGTFTDTRDNTVYNWVTIGDQVWMAENLAYLPSVNPVADVSESIAHYYVYGYDSTVVAYAKATSNYATYGVLYNWTAAMDGSGSSKTNPSGVQGVCPVEWHLPSHSEWTELINYVGGRSVAGGKLKEAGTNHWSDPNTDATNETGFTALPGGYLANDDETFRTSYKFFGIGSNGTWWSTTEFFSEEAWYRSMSFKFGNVHMYNSIKEVGYAVRCVRD